MLAIVELLRDGSYRLAFVLFHALLQLVDGLIDVAKRILTGLKLSKLSLNNHVIVRVSLLDGVSNLLRYRITPNVLQSFPCFVANPSSMLSSHDISDLVGRY